MQAPASGGRLSMRGAVCVAGLVLAVSCRTGAPGAAPAPEARPPAPTATAPAPPTPTPTPPVVRPAVEPLALTAWVEPAHLQPGGGGVEVFVRVRREGGGPYPGVEVLVSSDRGVLASGSRIISTDADGLARDRLTTERTAMLTVNAGGTIYRFPVPVLPAQADPNS